MEDVFHKWQVVLEAKSNEVVLNGRNIVVQNIETSEVGYVEDTPENRILLGISVEGSSQAQACSETSYIPERWDIDNDIAEEIEENHSSSTLFDAGWDKNTVQQLLNLYLVNANKFRNPKIKKRDLWHQIALQLHKDAESCDKKFRNLKQHYLYLLKKKTQSGRGAVTWNFFKIFEEIFENDENVHPERNMTIIDTFPSSGRITEKCHQPLQCQVEPILSRNKLIEKCIQPIQCGLENHKPNKYHPENVGLTSCQLVDDINVSLPPPNRIPIEKPQVTEVPHDLPDPKTDCTSNMKKRLRNTESNERKRRYDDIRILSHDINERQKKIEKKVDQLVNIVHESNDIQKERNNLFKEYLQKLNSNTT